MGRSIPGLFRMLDDDGLDVAAEGGRLLQHLVEAFADGAEAEQADAEGSGSAHAWDG